MNKCKDCKFWEKPDDDYTGEIPGVGKCNKVIQYWDATEWDHNYDNRQLKRTYAGKLAFVQDGSDYFAQLKTMPEFGCVQFESAR